MKRYYAKQWSNRKQHRLFQYSSAKAFSRRRTQEAAVFLVLISIFSRTEDDDEEARS